MNFTNEDLERLENALFSTGDPTGIPGTYVKVSLSGLLRRLKAAEDLIGIPIGSTSWNDRHKRWRKECGE